MAPLSDQHLHYEVELDADPEVMRYLGNGQASTREEVEELAVLRQLSRCRGSASGSVSSMGRSSAGGSSSRRREPTGPSAGQAELGFRILRRYWRMGFASEGARELIRYGFEDLGLARIFAETMTVYSGSRATMTAIGMQHVRTFHVDCDAPISGAEHGEVEYEITAELWSGQRARVRLNNS